MASPGRGRVAPELLSVGQVAQLLGLHVRTVRNYVRDGRLKATRIGKQYRIASADVEALAGHPVSASTVRRSLHIGVSAVVEVDAIDAEEASRVTTVLMAAINGPREGQPLRVDSLHEPERGRLRIVVLGGLEDATSLLKLVAALTEDSR